MHSIRGKTYRYLQPSDMVDVLQDLPLDLYQVLLSRMAPHEIADFLEPKLKNLLPDPYVLPDMEKACERAHQAILKQEKIAILGDYDVDGATSAALLVRFFRHHGITPEIYIPDRLKEGYGPNHQAFQLFKDKGCTLIFIVDCGTAAAQVLNVHKDVDIVILDHHLPTDVMPDVLALVNPQTVALGDSWIPDLPATQSSGKAELDEPCLPGSPKGYPGSGHNNAYLHHLSAGGVTFLFLIGLNRLCANKYDLMSLLDLVALSTVCDVMQLKGLNRAFVKQGLKLLQKTSNLGIQALCKVAGLNSIKTTYDLGFVIGPRINAGGRLGQSYLGVNILTTEDPKQAYVWAETLNELNKERQRLEEEILNTAINRVKDEGLDQNPCIVVYDPTWHAGVVGIIAARVREIYGKPAFVAGAEENGMAMGSARSVEGVNVGALLHKACEAGLLVSGGGHAKAGGFKMMVYDRHPREERSDELRIHKGGRVDPRIREDDSNGVTALYDFLNEQLLQQPPESTPDTIHIKRLLSGIDKSLADAIEQLHPFGPGQEEPLMALENVYFKMPSILKDQHIKCTLIDGLGCTLPAIAFKAMRYGLQPALYTDHQTHTCIGYLKNSPYGLQFQICDVVAN